MAQTHHRWHHTAVQAAGEYGILNFDAMVIMRYLEERLGCSQPTVLIWNASLCCFWLPFFRSIPGLHSLTLVISFLTLGVGIPFSIPRLTLRRSHRFHAYFPYPPASILVRAYCTRWTKIETRAVADWSILCANIICSEIINRLEDVQRYDRVSLKPASRKISGGWRSHTLLRCPAFEANTGQLYFSPTNRPPPLTFFSNLLSRFQPAFGVVAFCLTLASPHAWAVNAHSPVYAGMTRLIFLRRHTSPVWPLVYRRCVISRP